MSLALKRHYPVFCVAYNPVASLVDTCSVTSCGLRVSYVVNEVLLAEKCYPTREPSRRTEQQSTVHRNRIKFILVMLGKSEGRLLSGCISGKGKSFCPTVFYFYPAMP